MDRLSEIRARCEAFEDSNDSYKGVRPQYILPVLADDGYSRNWAEIAAHSHEDIPYLLARIEKAEAERDAAISRVCERCDSERGSDNCELCEFGPLPEPPEGE